MGWSIRLYPYYPAPEDFELAVKDYFEHCRRGEMRPCGVGDDGVEREEWVPIVPTLAGLADHIGFSSYATLLNYAKRGPKYLEVVEWARNEIENDLIRGASLGLYRPEVSKLRLMRDYGYTSVSEQRKPDSVKELTDEALALELKERLSRLSGVVDLRDVVSVVEVVGALPEADKEGGGNA